MEKRDTETLLENYEMFADNSINWVWRFFDKSLAELDERAASVNGFSPEYDEYYSLAMSAAVAAMRHWQETIKEIGNA